MSENKWSWLRVVPWEKVVERVPDLLDAARQSAQGAADDRRQQALEERVHDLERHEREQTRLVEQLTAQVSALTAEIDALRRRGKVNLYLAVTSALVALAALIGALAI